MGDAIPPVAVGEQALEWKRVSGPPPRAPMPAAYAPALSTLAVLIAAVLAAAPSHAAEADADPATTAATANVAASTLDAVVVTGSRTSTRTVKNSSTRSM